MAPKEELLPALESSAYQGGILDPRQGTRKHYYYWGEVRFTITAIVYILWSEVINIRKGHVKQTPVK